MQHKQGQGFFLFVFFLSIYLGVWVFAAVWSCTFYCSFFKLLATASGIIGYFCFSVSLLLSSRLKKLEDWMQGLDRVYSIHRILGLTSFCFILVHAAAESVRWLPADPARFFLFPRVVTYFFLECRRFGLDFADFSEVKGSSFNEEKSAKDRLNL